MNYLCVDWCAINWSAVGAIVTFFALCSTIYFSWQNRRMLIEARKARLIFSIISENLNNNTEEKGLYLIVKNVGQMPAADVHFKVNKEFIDCIHPDWRCRFEDIEKYPFRLGGGDMRGLPIMPINNKISYLLQDGSYLDINLLQKQLMTIQVTIQGNYKDTSLPSKNSEKIEEKFYVTEFGVHLLDVNKK